MSTLTKKTSPDVLVIGGGAAGMLAALFSARAGARTLLLEKNEKLGRKMYITGKGRCNVTNDCDAQEFLRQVPRNPRFLFGALHLLSPEDMKALLEENGCPVKVERGRRVFPVSDKASDVTRAIAGALQKAGCAVRLNAQVERIESDERGVSGVLLSDGEKIDARAVIVATGGLSYPSTGSTGDGYRFAQALGLAIVPPLPSLIPYDTAETWPRELQGLTLKNICLSAVYCGKILFCEQGELLFTHFGISGPLALELSSHAARLPLAEIKVSLDLKPGLHEEQLLDRLKRELAENGKRQLSTILKTLLPSRFADIFAQICGLDGEKTASQISAQERATLCGKLKALPLTLSETRPIAEAIVTSGGVAVNELSPKTMASKRVPGLFFAGELVDVDAHTGGYNLQIAFSTGALAGKSAAEYAQVQT